MVLDQILFMYSLTQKKYKQDFFNRPTFHLRETSSQEMDIMLNGNKEVYDVMA